uniref:Mei2-like C-terminal RNA recognition motif domain-containing protein n=1 Tax=Alexandrium monilatum TaxID=311494 RepID=A0A7S4VAA3_9DINO
MVCFQSPGEAETLRLLRPILVAEEVGEVDRRFYAHPSVSRQALVKNTFLEFVDADAEEEQPRILTSQTDSTVLGILNCRDGILPDVGGSKCETSSIGSHNPVVVMGPSVAACTFEEPAAHAHTTLAAVAGELAAAVPARENTSRIPANLFAGFQVKNTFLEFVGAGEDDEVEQPRILTSQTDSKALGIWNCRDGAFQTAGEDGLVLSEPESKELAATHPSEGPPESACEFEAPAGLGVDVQLRLKNTFLEVAEEEDDDEPQGKITKSSTDSAALLRCDPLPGSHRAPLDLLKLDVDPKQGSGAVRDAATEETDADLASACIFEHESIRAQPAEEPCARMAAMDSKDQPVDAGVPPRARERRAVGAHRGRPLESEDSSYATGAEEAPTTLMLRNVPNDYTRSMLLELLDATGFAGRYDFIYYPTDFSRRAGLGYAFVDMVSPADAVRVSRALEGFRRWSVPSSKVCSVGWSVPCQGLEANIERYRNSPIMHKSVPDEYKPAMFKEGHRVPFPKPTRKLRRPDSRRGGC